MRQFAALFSELEIVVPLARHLSWSHFLILIPLPSQEARLFYASQALSDGYLEHDLECAQAGTEQVELMNLQKDNIMVAEYWTELPPKAVLEEKLHTALIEIKARLAAQKRIEKS